MDAVGKMIEDQLRPLAWSLAVGKSVEDQLRPLGPIYLEVEYIHILILSCFNRTSGNLSDTLPLNLVVLLLYCSGNCSKLRCLASHRECPCLLYIKSSASSLMKRVFGTLRGTTIGRLGTWRVFLQTVEVDKPPLYVGETRCDWYKSGDLIGMPFFQYSISWGGDPTFLPMYEALG